MRIDEAMSGTWQHGDAERFSGDVWVRYALTDADGSTLAEVHFSGGARTHWHRHPKGQFIYVLAGRGRARTRGEEGRVLRPGDVVHVAAEEWHFHGGEPGSPMTHVALSLGGTPEWGAPVQDTEYDEGF